MSTQHDRLNSQQISSALMNERMPGQAFLNGSLWKLNGNCADVVESMYGKFGNVIHPAIVNGDALIGSESLQ
ncbi:hypothetical protein M514_05287 [Trichuris suis]|uniref:Uncharacterized protein n=1 Tax=Trichuris suis TaxID=68888 RepID=A0A085M985_9BILA|nr:hypothetical protein M513_05287 [Trichuris suis]KFD71577.1 hypothetical protein M514_05287 [Trichuris suis]